MSLRVSRSTRAFHLPRLAGGVGMKVGTNIWAPVGSLALLGDSVWLAIILIVVAATVHASLAWFFKKDHKLFESYAIYIETKDVYDAGASSSAEGFLGMMRVKGFGKGIPC